MNEKDTLRHQGQRNQLINLVRRKGIKDDNVLNAMNNVPRHLFLDSSFEAHAYQDKAFRIAADQTISQPYTVAKQSELLNVKFGDKVLEIGTGSGYQASVLIEMGIEVYTIERQRELYDITKNLLRNLRYQPKRMVYGDGYKGLPNDAPFDGIVVTAGAPFIPNELLKQLKIGATLVIPVGEENEGMIMTTIKRKSAKEFVKKKHGDFRFVPMLKDTEN
ncbi:MAG: protein-L-isoaspartate(D-aspartate) O-methyltransferase [Ichthyobacteriaceae bacterium]|nr:protein-L-isoaspartate(D-aspartate) O-methyltransferase [Ichthyobacteriaceae bacterium]